MEAHTRQFILSKSPINDFESFLKSHLNITIIHDIWGLKCSQKCKKIIIISYDNNFYSWYLDIDMLNPVPGQQLLSYKTHDTLEKSIKRFRFNPMFQQKHTSHKLPNYENIQDYITNKQAISSLEFMTKMYKINDPLLQLKIESTMDQMDHQSNYVIYENEFLTLCDHNNIKTLISLLTV